MIPWERILVERTKTVFEAIKAIDTFPYHIGLVVDADRKLVGTVTDGDVRRAIINGATMQSPIESIMNTNPITVQPDTPDSVIDEYARIKRIRQFPVLDEEGRVIDINMTGSQWTNSSYISNWVVLMAGGLGSRLRPLTEDVPKPLLNVGNKPLMETILENFVDVGFSKFFISVNYKAEMIKDHFGDGKSKSIDIQYMEESSRMGTAGSLCLLPERPELPFIVMNCDLLTKVNFRQLLEFHEQQDSKATMCVREYDFQVPYGVIEIEDHCISRIDEKPVHRFFVNAGIYVLDPDIIDFVPRGKAFDMTTLFEKIILDGHNTAAFPIREYWLDVGQRDDLIQANGEFDEYFRK